MYYTSVCFHLNVKGKTLLSLFYRLHRSVVLIYNKVNKRVTRQSKLS
jgi:hypothetical protein